VVMAAMVEIITPMLKAILVIIMGTLDILAVEDTAEEIITWEHIMPTEEI